MHTRQVGTSGLRVSRLGLGTMTWGRAAAARDADALFGAFRAAARKVVRTGPACGHGAVGRLLGAIFAKAGCRDDIVLATQAGFVARDGVRVVDTSRRTLLDDLTASLKRLRTDSVDLWQIHAWGDAPIEETLSARSEARR